MKCSEIQFDLTLFGDNVLSAERSEIISEHLNRCPLCRQNLTELQTLKQSLRSLPRPVLDSQKVDTLRMAVTRQLNGHRETPAFQLLQDRRKWVDVWLMPYAVGAMATVLLGMTMTWFVVTGEVRTANYQPSRSTASESQITVLSPLVPPVVSDSEIDPKEYARSRSVYSFESPSLNPKGKLVELTETIMHDDTKNDEVVVVADVYGDGRAEIANVVERSSNRNAIPELQKAMSSGAPNSPFVPASFDNRSEPVRVVFKIQNVNVSTGLH